MLPKELLVEIFGYLATGDLRKCCQVCKEWNQLIIWEGLCKKRWKRTLCDVDEYKGNWKRMCLDGNLKNRATLWNWDPKFCGKGIQITGDTVTFARPTGPCQVLCDIPCIKPERYYVEFRVLKTNVRAINFGVCSKQASLDARCGRDSYGWSYSLYSGTIYHNGSWKDYDKSDKRNKKANHSVGIAIDMDKGAITFFLNGKSLGALHEQLPDELYASVSLGELGDSVAIVRKPQIPKF